MRSICPRVAGLTSLEMSSRKDQPRKTSLCLRISRKEQILYIRICIMHLFIVNNASLTILRWKAFSSGSRAKSQPRLSFKTTSSPARELRFTAGHCRRRMRTCPSYRAFSTRTLLAAKSECLTESSMSEHMDSTESVRTNLDRSVARSLLLLAESQSAAEMRTTQRATRT